MKFYKTAILGLVSLAVLGGAYYYAVVRDQQQQEEEDQKSKIIYLKKEQINYLEIQSKNKKFVFQKDGQGWSVQEPIVDIADSEKINNILEQLTDEKSVAIAKEGDDIKWSEFGLDNPSATLIFKNNLGNSQKVFISDLKNFEGHNYARIDNRQSVLVLQSLWQALTDEKLVFFRQKRLYREPVANIQKVTVQSLRDRFTLVRNEKGWVSYGYESFILDQNKVREMIKTIADNTIQDYITEGEPSDSEKREKGLDHGYAQVTFETDQENQKWSIRVNQSEKDRALYALTDRPTYLLKLDLSQWEFFGNLTLDSLRDRKTILRFDISDVHHIFIKKGELKYEFLKDKEGWKIASEDDQSHLINSKAIDQLISKVHDLELSYFLDDEKETKTFTGKDMIILKSSNDQLLFQINWGPMAHKKIDGVERDFYLARTQLSESVFGLSRELIDNLPIEKTMKTSDGSNIKSEASGEL
ncbi:MAG: DUF4340 domain-containing protein [Pseudobdellovibrio sp.]